MRHSIAFGIKLIIVSIITLSLFGIFYHASFTSLLMMSLIATVTGYLIGDLFVLHRFGNVIASLADFVLNFVTIWLLAGIFVGATTGITITSLAAAYLLTATEPLFHAYMIERVFGEERERADVVPLQFQTEFAEEQDPEVKKNKQTDIDPHK